MNQVPGEFILAFLGMVFTAMFLLSQGLTIPVFGEANQVRKRIRGRLNLLERANNLPNMQSILRQKYLRRLPPLEARLEQLPMSGTEARRVGQAGRARRAQRE